MKKLMLFSVVFFGLINFSISGEQKVVSRDNTHFREGPGSYYPLIGMLKKGAGVETVETQAGWLKVKYADKFGWVSENALATGATGGSLSSMTTGGAPLLISKASASGAVKGFAQKFIDFHKGDPTFLDQYEAPIFSPYEYLRFRQETYTGRDSEKIRKRYKRIKTENIDHSIPFGQEKVGLAAASKIAALGLVKDQAKVKYLNLVGNIIVDNTDMFDYPFKFFILDDKRISAYAVPNGMIFLTSGLLDIIQDEAELACVLGHEITHVVQKHGFQELAKRSTMIEAEDAFAEFDAEMQTEDDTIEAELDQIALNSYEAATKKRQMKYEYEADELGIIYAYRSGYDPSALNRVLARLKANTSRDFWHPESNWAYDSILDRVEKIDAFIAKNLTKNPDWNVTNQMRYRGYFKK